MLNKFNDPAYFLNRELTQLSFNENVLTQAKSDAVPLLERLKFLLICTRNLDEFFEIRVAGLKEKLRFDMQKPSIDGLNPSELLDKISNKSHLLVDEINYIYKQILIPLLEKEEIYFRKPNFNKKFNQWCSNYFDTKIMPLLNPLGLDSAHPFPKLANKSLNFIVSLKGKDAFGRDSRYAIVHAPRTLSRVILIPTDILTTGENYIFLGDLISFFVDKLFPGMTITGCYQCRLTRNSDLYVDDEEAKDLALELKRKLHMRNFGHVVRLEIEKNCPSKIVEFLCNTHELSEKDVYYYDGPVNLNRYLLLYNLSKREDLKYTNIIASSPYSQLDGNDIFQTLKKRDILLHHPYQSFDNVIDFIRQATICPNVLTIKQTLYRTHSKSSMVQALIDAARAGKEVTAVIELRARFDEESNLSLAQELQAAGVVVVYGLVDFKIHAKMSLVIRREEDSLCRYAHLATGNYHERTARLYEDYGFITGNPLITEDVLTIFQQITGMGKIQKLKTLFHSPFTLNQQIINLINQQIELVKQNKNPEIYIKVNGLTDKRIIKHLYHASSEGVSIKLVVRTFCCLRPKVAKVSENIEVISVIGRFLEHSRIYYFKSDKQERLYLSSADLMERNLHHRVEVLFPITDPNNLKQILKETFLNYYDKDSQAFQLQNDGNYQRIGKQSPQERLINRYTKT